MVEGMIWSAYMSTCLLGAGKQEESRAGCGRLKRGSESYLVCRHGSSSRI